MLASMSGVTRQEWPSSLYGSGLRLLECAPPTREGPRLFGGSPAACGTRRSRRTASPSSPFASAARFASTSASFKSNTAVFGAGGRSRRVTRRLAAKYPNASREWPWQWVFPATRSYVHAETQQRRRTPCA